MRSWTRDLARPARMWSSLWVPKRREKTLEDGETRIVDDQASSPDAGLELAREIVAECPDGYHPWRIQVQKSDRGRRASVRVWFKRNVPGGQATQ